MDIVLCNNELVPMMYQDLKSLVPWLGQYLKPTEDTVRKMTDSMNKLRSRMLSVVHKLEEVCDNGWSPRDSTIEWIHKGLDCHRRVQVIVNRYILLARGSGGGSAAESMLHCPCHAILSSRQMNMEALKMIVDVTGHYTEGETYEGEDYETVAIPGRKRSDVLQELNDLMPKVKQLMRYSEDTSAPHSVCLSLQILLGDSQYENESWPILEPSSSREDLRKRHHIRVPGSRGHRTSHRMASVIRTHGWSEEQTLMYNFLGGRKLAPAHVGAPPQAHLPLPETIEKLDVSALSMYKALSRWEDEDSTPVMIRVKAPRYTYGSRAPIDLVMVLDITGSMAGEKLSQIKKGALFVLRNLQAEDRLSIVALDNCTHLLFPLTYLWDEVTKARAKTKIMELPSTAAPSYVILAPAMDAVYQILRGRPVGTHLARVMVLTDGGLDGKQGVICDDYPTYTFGLGPEHDRWKTYGIASHARGTYSFDSTPDLKSIGTAMALCIGGLTSIAAHRLYINIYSVHRGVRISRITSGAYDSCVIENGTLASITVDDIYSSEEKNFLIYINIPRDEASGRGFFFPRTSKTKLLTVRSQYYSHVSNSFVHLDPVEVSVERKGQTQASSQATDVAGKVLRARVLQEVAKIAAFKAEARTDLQGISSVRASIQDTSEAKAAKDMWDGLSRDLDNMEDADTGLGFMLSWLTSHQWQRAAMPSSMSKINFITTRMKNLVDSVDLAPVDMHAGT